MADKSIFEDDKFEHIEDDVEKIRVRTGMYVPYKGPEGAMHLVHELGDNILDELNNEKSPGSLFEIEFDEEKNQITARDDGRGIAFDYVQMLCSYIQSGSKFDRDNGDDSAGENGVGLTAVNALSHSLIFEIKRQISSNTSQKGTFRFSEGKFLGSELGKVYEGAEHGTKVTMVPSTEILGDCQIDAKELHDWLNKLSFVSRGIPIRYKFKPRKGETQKFNFKRKNGIADLVDVMVNNKLIPTIVVTGSSPENKISLVEMAFTFNPKAMGENVDSFMNRINTIESGVHVSAAKAAIGNLLSKMANEALTAAEKKKGIEVLPSDITQGLVLVVNGSTKIPGFVGQQKEKVGNKQLFAPMRRILQNGLKSYLDSNQKVAEKLVAYIKRAAKARATYVEIKKNDLANDSFEQSKLTSYSPATEDSDQNELIINEGLSAKGSVTRARDPRYQAVLALRGVTANMLYLSPDQVRANAVYGKLIDISNMGIGADFNLKKSKFARYILATDADIDGGRIASSTSCSFFLVHWTPVVEAGMLYRALTPLYMVETLDKKHEFFISKAKLFDYKVEQYIKSAQIRRKDGHVLTKREFEDFLYKNKNYQDILKELYSHEFVHPRVIEFVVADKDKGFFELALKEKFPELYVEGKNILTGSYNGTYQFLMMDSIFEKKATTLRNIIASNDDEIYFDYKDKDMDTWATEISIGEIFDNLSKYDGKILSRWKGLGSIPPNIFWDIVLNPKKRTLLRLTVDDLEKDLRDAHILHGNNAELRRRLLQAYKLDKDDIDS